MAYKAEEPGRVDLTCAMGGLILLSKLMVKNKNLPDIIEELKARDVPLTNYKDKDIKALKELLKISEAKRLVEEESSKESIPWQKINTIKPQSEALKALLQTLTFQATTTMNNENDNHNEP